jgi:hypothetical protein
VTCYNDANGKSREEIVEKLRREYGDDRLPEILKLPPEVEEMHREIGYDA